MLACSRSLTSLLPSLLKRNVPMFDSELNKGENLIRAVTGLEKQDEFYSDDALHRCCKYKM